MLEEILIKKISIWICLWLLIVGGSIYLLKLIGADQYNRFSITTAYFYCFAFFGLFFYRIKEVLSNHASMTKQGPIIFAFVLLVATLCLFIESTAPIGLKTHSKIMALGFYFPLFKYETLATKIADITFQQVFIFSLITELKKENLENRKIVMFFSIAFFLVHLPLVFSMGTVAFYFIFPSVFAGLLFAYLILNFRYGLSYSYIVHLSFYFLIGLYFRFLI